MKYLIKVFLSFLVASLLFTQFLYGQQGQMDWRREIPSATWAARYGHCSVVFDNRLWILGGITMYSQLKRDVWSTPDGVNWTCATNTAGWSARSGHSAVVFNDRIWVMGGRDNDYLNDIWSSSDGINWTREVDSAPWRRRGSFSLLVYDDKIWLMGGRISSTRTLNDVWCSADGVNWTLATDSANWSKRDRHGSIVYDNKMWVISGLIITGSPSDVWHSVDGVNWICATNNAPWDIRKDVRLAVYDNKMWLVGGYRAYESYRNDAWYSSDGANWFNASNACAWSARHGHSVDVFNNRIFLVGGHDGLDSYRNDVWSSRASRIMTLEPNGGEIYSGGSSQTIKWFSYHNNSDYFRLLLSRGGTYSDTIANMLSGSETTYTWTLPLINHANNRVMVQVINNSGAVIVQDTSDNPFTIQTLKMVLPSGGEVLDGGSNYTIKWRKYFDNFSHYRLILINYYGAGPETIAHNIPASDSIYDWSVPILNARLCQIKIQMLDVNNTILCEAISSSFQVRTLEILAPNGGEIWLSGTIQAIKWRVTDHNSFSSYQIFISTDGGNTIYDTIAKNINVYDTMFYWLVIPVDVSNCHIIIQALNASGQVICQDASDISFTIRTRIVIISPNGGENYLGGESTNIKWRIEGGGLIYCRLLFSYDNGWNYPDTIVHNLAGIESTYAWTVPTINSQWCWIKIQLFNSRHGQICEDMNNLSFTIKTVILTRPNGNENWVGGSYEPIKWRAASDTNCVRFRLMLSKNSGGSYLDTIADNIQTSESTYLWQVPFLNLNTCRIRVQAINALNNILSDDSSNYDFFIRTRPTIIMPNGGQSWLAGTVQTVQWSVIGTGFARYRLLLSQNNGSTYPETIAHNVSPTQTSYSWTLPNINALYCRVKIQIIDSLGSVAGEDASDANFSIQTLITVSPNGNEVWPGGSYQTIKWRIAPNINPSGFRILLSRNYGMSYPDTIANYITGTDSTFLWLTPPINTNACLIKVQALDSLSGILLAEDVSNTYFTIRTLPTVISPNGGENWLGNTSRIIKWSVLGTGHDHYRILLSQNSGISYLDTVAHNVNGADSTFLWLTPLINSTICRIKVQMLDILNNVISEDASNSNFTIQSILVVFPNGGEIFSGLSNQVIQWQNTRWRWFTIAYVV